MFRLPIRPFAKAGRVAVVLCGLPLLAGCAFDEKPTLGLDIPGKYRAASTRPDAALPKPDWWRSFRSRSLTRLVEVALTDNFDVAQAAARIVQADAQARITGSALLPVVNLDASASRSRSSLLGGSSGTVSTGRSRDRRFYSAALNASYQLDFWGRNRTLLEAAEETAVANRYARDVVALSAAASVANTYFNLVAAQERLRIANQNVASAQRILKLIQDRLAAGTGTSLDVAQQETILAQQRATIPQLRQQVEQTRATLALLIGAPPENVQINGEALFTLAVPRITPGLPSDLLLRRPDIAQAEANLVAANADVKAARLAFFPTITLTGSAGYESSILRKLFDPTALALSAAAGLTQPIFDGFRLQGELDLARARQAELLQAYRQAIVSGFTDVENALVAVRELANEEAAQRQAVASARRAFEISEQRLREGTIDLVTVLNTQQSLFQAQQALAQVRQQRLQAAASLYQALGGGWPAGMQPGT